MRNIECIHGHFLADKYSYYNVQSNTFITWLRDPIERLGSHYEYWKRSYNPVRSLPLHKRVIEENWSFKEFCFSKEMKNLYSRFLLNFPKENFAFIGIIEYFEEDFRFFTAHYLGTEPIIMDTKNVNPNKQKPYAVDLPYYEELKAYHALDYELYNYALALREERSENS